MIRLLILCIALAMSTAVNGQSQTASDIIGPWLGHWKGQLAWQVAPDSLQWVPMQLRIMPLDTPGWYSWNLVYGEAQSDNRGYVLKPVDLAHGHWVVDEGNGIVIDQYLMGQSFVSSFEVMGNTIVDEFELDGDRMEVRFFSFDASSPSTSGRGTEESPTVVSHRLVSLQKVELKRIR